jgi:hypothetical protein
MSEELDELMVDGAAGFLRPLERPAWVTGTDGKRYLPIRVPTERYQPMRERPALNAELAHLEPSEDAIVDFVARNGWLGIGGWFPTEDGEDYGEPLDTWRAELASFRWAWGVVNGESDLGVLDFFEESEHKDSEGRTWLLLSYLPPPRGGGAVKVPAYPNRSRVLAHAANRVIATYLSEPLRDHAGAFLRVSDDGRPALGYGPSSVLGAAYLQLAEDFEGSSSPRYGKCQTCGRIYRVSERNPSQKGCGSSKCRQARYATNRDSAYRMSGEGLAPRTIASRMSQNSGEKVTVEQVRRWIAAAEKRQGKRVRGSRGDA